MSDRTAASRARPRRSEAFNEQRRLERALRQAQRLLKLSTPHRANPEDDDEDPTRRAGARRGVTPRR